MISRMELNLAKSPLTIQPCELLCRGHNPSFRPSYQESIENSRHDHVLSATFPMRASSHMHASAYTLVRGQVVVIPSARMLNLTRRGADGMLPAGRRSPVAPAVSGV